MELLCGRVGRGGWVELLFCCLFVSKSPAYVRSNHFMLLAFLFHVGTYLKCCVDFCLLWMYKKNSAREHGALPIGGHSAPLHFVLPYLPPQPMPFACPSGL